MSYLNCFISRSQDLEIKFSNADFKIHFSEHWRVEMTDGLQICFSLSTYSVIQTSGHRRVLQGHRLSYLFSYQNTTDLNFKRLNSILSIVDSYDKFIDGEMLLMFFFLFSRCVSVAEHFFSSHIGVKLLQVSWHPGSSSDSHIVFLTSDNLLR